MSATPAVLPAGSATAEGGLCNGGGRGGSATAVDGTGGEASSDLKEPGSLRRTRVGGVGMATIGYRVLQNETLAFKKVVRACVCMCMWVSLCKGISAYCCA